MNFLKNWLIPRSRKRWSGPRVDLCVDIVVVSLDGYVLLGLKNNRPEELSRPSAVFQFPGGFTDPVQDESPSQTALRELGEETGLSIYKPAVAAIEQEIKLNPSDFELLGIYEITDERYTFPVKDKLWSAVFMLELPVEHSHTQIFPGSDLDALIWMPSGHVENYLLSKHLTVWNSLKYIYPEKFLTKPKDIEHLWLKAFGGS